jgi:phosphate transport system substrate-binding protein
MSNGSQHKIPWLIHLAIVTIGLGFIISQIANEVHFSLSVNIIVLVVMVTFLFIYDMGLKPQGIILGVLVSVALVEVVVLVVPSMLPESLPPRFTDCHVTWDKLLARTSQNATAGTVSLSASELSSTLIVSGSSALAPLIEDAKNEFNAANGTQIRVIPNESKTGLIDVLNNNAEIGLADFFKDEPAKHTLAPSSSDLAIRDAALDDLLIAISPIVFIVNSDLQHSLRNLPKKDLKKVFQGAQSWQDIGIPVDEKITLVTRSIDNSGTQLTIQDLLGDFHKASNQIESNSTQDVINTVASTPGAIGYVSLSGIVAALSSSSANSDIRSKISPVCVDSFASTATDISDGDYPYWMFEHAYLKYPARSLLARKFLWYVCFGDFQIKDLPHDGYLPVTQIPSSLYQSRYGSEKTVDCAAHLFDEYNGSI